MMVAEHKQPVVAQNPVTLGENPPQLLGECRGIDILDFRLVAS